MEKQEILAVLVEASQYLGGFSAKYPVDLSYKIDKAMMAINLSGTIIGKDIEVVGSGPYTIREYQ